MSTNRTIKREAQCELSEHELSLYGGYMAEKLKEVERIKDEAKRVSAEYKARMMKLNEEISRLAEARVKGFEVRPVMCEERWHAGSIQVVRVDTGEVIDARPATLADAQENLPISGTTDLRSVDKEPGRVIDLGVGKAVTSSVGDTVFVARDDEDPGAADQEADYQAAAAWEEDVGETVDVDVEVDGLDADGNVLEDVPPQTIAEAAAELDQAELDAAHEARKAVEAEQKAAEAKPAKGKGGKKRSR